jgi:hypothetical protein
LGDETSLRLTKHRAGESVRVWLRLLFGDEQHKLFGDDGFEEIVDEVANLEKRMGIDNLPQFTSA